MPNAPAATAETAVAAQGAYGVAAASIRPRVVSVGAAGGTEAAVFVQRLWLHNRVMTAL